MHAIAGSPAVLILHWIWLPQHWIWHPHMAFTPIACNRRFTGGINITLDLASKSGVYAQSPFLVLWRRPKAVRNRVTRRAPKGAPKWELFGVASSRAGRGYVGFCHSICGSRARACRPHGVEVLGRFWPGRGVLDPPMRLRSQKLQNAPS